MSGSTLTPLLSPGWEGLGLHSKGLQAINSSPLQGYRPLSKGLLLFPLFSAVLLFRTTKKELCCLGELARTGHDIVPGEDHHFPKIVRFPMNISFLFPIR